MASPSSRPGEPRPVPAPSNPILLEAQSQWIFTDEELTRTPSQLDGMSMEAELTSRSKGVNFITQVGIMLKLPQLTLATAAVYLHRFFMRFSMVDLPQRPGMHPYPIAATSLFLASKVEENCRKMKEFVIACCRVAQKQPNLVVDEQSKEFWKWRDTILHNEDLLLEALCFDLQLEQPYRILYEFICFFGLKENKHLRNASWAFVNDSMYTVLCLQFYPRTIAAAALYAAARHCNVAFEDDEFGRPWWEQIDVDLTEVRRACARMAELYERNTVYKHSHHYPTTPIHVDEDPGKTRIPRRSSAAGVPPPEEEETNGRKRSREPEDETESRHGSSNPPQEESRTGTATNGASFDSASNPERSSKRQRIIPQDGGHDSSSKSREADAGGSQQSSSQSRSMNGHHASSSSFSSTSSTSHLPPPPSNQQHPLPPIPPAPARRNSHSNNSNNHNADAPAVDPVQQRIDEIVAQNSGNVGGDRRRSDHYRPPPRDRDRDRDRDREWDRERDRDWDHERRRSSGSGPGDGGGGGGRKSSFDSRHPPPPEPDREQQQQQKQASQDEAEEGEVIEEGGGSEEGEL